jgi:preprotein translocase subunit SecG
MNYLGISRIFQLILAILITFLVLIQSKGTGLSSAVGNIGGYYRTKRGIEKLVFVITVISGVLFVLNSLFIVLLS